MVSQLTTPGIWGEVWRECLWIIILTILVYPCNGQNIEQTNDELTQWACGWSGNKPAEVTQTSTTIRSPTIEHNDTYMLRQDCHWRVEAPQGKVISLTFFDFDLEHTYTCVYAYVNVYDHHEAYEQDIIDTFCGRVLPSVTHSSVHYMYIVFVSREQGEGRGFEARVDFISVNDVACGRGRPDVLDWAQGGFVSPGWPSDYNTDAYCSWRLDSTVSVRLEFTEWDIRPPEDTDTGTTCKDSITIYDGPTVTDPLLGTFCGSDVPDPVGNSVNKMLVVFQSLDWFYPHSGKFRAKFTSLNLTDKACGDKSPADIDWSPGNIVGPLSDISDCSWRFTAPEGKVIRFKINSFDLPDHCSNCGCSSVRIYDGHGYNGFSPSDLIGEYCGQGWTQEFVQSGGNKATMEYESYDLFGMTGFTIKYFFYDFADHACSGERPINLTDHYGIIASPHYDRSYYPPNARCEWAIHTELGKIVEIHYLTFKLQSCPACLCDVLYLYNGDQPLEENQAQEICDFTNPDKLLWTSLPGAYLRFLTDESISEEGFKIEYELKNLSDIACGQTSPARMTMAPGDILSPNYGIANYPQFVRCYWLLQTVYEKRIHLSFVDFDIEYDIPERCSFDWLAVYDGETTDSPLLGKFCGFELPKALYSTSRVMLIEFWTNYYVEGRGFHLQFTHTDPPSRRGNAHIIAPAVVCSVLAAGALIALLVIYCKKRFMKRIRRQSEPPRPPLRLDNLLQNIQNRRANPSSRNSSQTQLQANTEESYYTDIDPYVLGTGGRSAGRPLSYTDNNFSLMLRPPSYQESGQPSNPPLIDCPPPTYEESLHHPIATNGQISIPETSFGRNISRTDPEELNSTHATDVGSSSRLWERDTTVNVSRADFDTTGYEEVFNDGFINDEELNSTQNHVVPVEGHTALNLSRVSNQRRGTISSETHDRSHDQPRAQLRQALQSHDAQVTARNTAANAEYSMNNTQISINPMAGTDQGLPESSRANKLAQLRHVLQHGHSLDGRSTGVQMRPKDKDNSQADAKRLSKSYDNILYMHPKITGSTRSLEILDKREPQTSSAEHSAFRLRRRTKSETNVPLRFVTVDIDVDGEGCSNGTRRDNKMESSI